MIPSGAGSSSCFPNLLSPQILKMYAVPADDVVSSSAINPSVELSQLNSLFYNASILKDKIHQVQSMATILLSTDHHHPPPYEHHDHDHDHHQTHQHFSIAMANMSSVVQEIIVAASSMMFTCQQVNISAGNNAGASTVSNDTNNINASTGLFLQNKSPLHNQSSPDNHHPNFDRVGDVISPDGGGQSQSFYSGNSFEWFGSTTAAAAAATHDHNNYYVNPSNPNHDHANGSMLTGNETGVEVIRREFSHGVSSISGVSSWNTRNSNNNNSSSSNRNRSNNNKNNYDIIELDPEELLAKYTHYCQVCGKGFKRDANLRMHMRAHGDEYKSNAALTNPMKNSNQNLANSMYMGSNNNNLDKNCENPSPTSTKYPKKYSCPQEGCRWNKKHAKFQPLKSIICVKNHYKRSHCPKMYVCKRCNRKQFSVLSDLRTHEKHCGELKWQCSCGTTFSRKDKLMGHVALFVGHTPAVNVGGRSSTRVGNLVLNNHQQQVVQML